VAAEQVGQPRLSIGVCVGEKHHRQHPRRQVVGRSVTILRRMTPAPSHRIRRQESTKPLSTKKKEHRRSAKDTMTPTNQCATPVSANGLIGPVGRRGSRDSHVKKERGKCARKRARLNESSLLSALRFWRSRGTSTVWAPCRLSVGLLRFRVRQRARQPPAESSSTFYYSSAYYSSAARWPFFRSAVTARNLEDAHARRPLR